VISTTLPTILLAGAIAISPAAAASKHPAVRVVDGSPVRVAGTGFGGGERVTVKLSVSGSGVVSKVVRATMAGRFSAVFAQRTLSDCVTYSVVATGWRGSRASVKRIQPPAPCGYVPTDP
jgi:hypothetical protein